MASLMAGGWSATVSDSGSGWVKLLSTSAPSAPLATAKRYFSAVSSPTSAPSPSMTTSVSASLTSRPSTVTVASLPKSPVISRPLMEPEAADAEVSSPPSLSSEPQAASPEMSRSAAGTATVRRCMQDTPEGVGGGAGWVDWSH